MNIHRIRSIAIATVVVALAVAGPASATKSKNPPPAKKGCEIQLKGPGAGQSVVYPDGYSFSVQGQDNKTHTYKCNDGTWKETVSITVGPVSSPKIAIVGAVAGTLQAVQI